MNKIAIALAGITIANARTSSEWADRTIYQILTGSYFLT